MKVRSVAGLLGIAGILSMCSVTAALAAPLILVCQFASQPEPLRLTLDIEAKTMSSNVSWWVENEPAAITESMIKWNAAYKDDPEYVRRPATLDRVTGVVHIEVCDRTSCSTNNYTGQCHKGEQQF
jgi:hypothetical protein